MPHCQQWLTHQQARGLSAATVRRRRWAVQHLRRHGADPLTATVDDIENALLHLNTPQTRRCFISDLRMFYKWARRRGLRQDDPTEMLDTIPLPSRLPTPLSRDDLTLAAKTADPVTRLMIMLGCLAGLRVSEIGRLHTRDIGPDHLVVRGGKGGKDRVVPLHPVLAEELAKLPGHGPIFGLKGDTVSERIRKVFRECHIEHRPHDLRATFATAAAEQCNGNLSTVAALLGHSNPETTRRYTAWVPDASDVVRRLYMTATTKPVAAIAAVAAVAAGW